MKKLFYVIVSLCFFSMTSCSKDDEAAPTPPGKFEDVEISSNEGTRTINLLSEGKSIINPAAAEWCTPQLAGSRLMLLVKENFSDNSRLVTYKIETVTGEKSITVRQNPQPDITVAGDIPTVDKKGENVTVDINSNIDYTVEFNPQNQNWVTVIKATKNGVEFKCSPNNDQKARSVEVRLLDCEHNVIYSFTISQQGNQPRNVILYTSTDGGKVLPSTSSSAFGSGFTIVSNTYFNGEGTITFDGDINGLSAAFANCTNLKTISLPEGIEYIGKRSFYNCTNLAEISIPATVTSIGEEAFYKCSSLNSIALPEGITEFKDRTFYYTGLGSIRFPDKLKSIGVSAFGECNKLEIVEINSILKSVGNSCFDGCSNIKELIFPKSTIEFGDNCFGKITGDVSLYINENTLFNGNPFYSFSGYFILPADNTDNSGLIGLGIKFADSENFKGFKGKFAAEGDNHCLIVNKTLYACYLMNYDEPKYAFPEGIKHIARNAIKCKPLLSGATNAYPGVFIFPEGLETVESPLINRAYGNLFSSSYWIAVFPESLKKIREYKDYELLNSFTSWRVYFQSNTPPSLDCIFMYWQNLDRVTKLEICVPEGAADTYKQAWPDYARYIVEKSY